MEKTNTNIIEQLKEASSRLLFMSESEYPFDVVEWDIKEQSLTPEKLLQLTNHPPTTSVQVTDVDSFFEMATTEQDWYEESEKEIAKKYQHLLSILKTNLTDVKVYKIGEINIDVYIVGKTPESSWAGLSTKVVET